MIYFVAIFFPFVSFFYIKKPVSGYFAFVFHVLAFLGVSIYPTVYVLFIIWFLLILWAFFEVNEFNSKEAVLHIVKKLVRQNKLLLRDVAEIRKDKKDSYKSIDYDLDYDDLIETRDNRQDRYPERGYERDIQPNYNNTIPVRPATTSLPPYRAPSTNFSNSDWSRPRRVTDYAPQIKESNTNPLYKTPTLPSSYSPRNRGR